MEAPERTGISVWQSVRSSRPQLKSMQYQCSSKMKQLIAKHCAAVACDPRVQQKVPGFSHQIQRSWSTRVYASRLGAAIPCQMCSWNAVLQLQVAKMKPDQFRFAFNFGRSRSVALETQPGFQEFNPLLAPLRIKPEQPFSKLAHHQQSPTKRPTMNRHRHQ